MNFGQILWGTEAKPATALVVVLEQGAPLPVSRFSGRQLHLIAAQSGEARDTFSSRLKSRLSRISVPVPEAILCMNAEHGWRAILGRLTLVRKLVSNFRGKKARLRLLSPNMGDPNFSTELLTLVDLLRKDYPWVQVDIQSPLPSRAA